MAIPRAKRLQPLPEYLLTTRPVVSERLPDPVIVHENRYRLGADGGAVSAVIRLVLSILGDVDTLAGRCTELANHIVQRGGEIRLVCDAFERRVEHEPDATSGNGIPNGIPQSGGGDIFESAE